MQVLNLDEKNTERMDAINKFTLMDDTFMTQVFSSDLECTEELLKIDPMYKVVPYKGMPETLKELKKHGMKLAVCSNKPHPAAVKVIAQLFGEEFDMVVGQSDAIRRKPAPDGPLMVAGKFGVKPEECMYVGDTSTDMKTGKAAGMFTVGALWGFRDREELNENGADIVAEAPTDLVKICEEHGND